MDRARLEALLAEARAVVPTQTRTSEAAWWAAEILEALLAPDPTTMADWSRPAVLAPRTLHEQFFPGEPAPVPAVRSGTPRSDG